MFFLHNKIKESVLNSIVIYFGHFSEPITFPDNKKEF